VIERVKRWQSWAAKFGERYARRTGRGTSSFTLLKRAFGVSMTHSRVVRPFTLIVAPRVSVDGRSWVSPVRTNEMRERERVVVHAGSRKGLAPAEVGAAPPAAFPLTTVETAMSRYFVSRSEYALESRRILRRVQTELAGETETLRRRNCSTVAVEHAALLKRRFQREESTLTTTVRSIQRQVVRSAPAQPEAHSSRPSLPESVLAWPAAPSPMPTLDSISDHVMQQIDRKLVAHRERMGRI
jgi:hypothetical protein